MEKAPAVPNSGGFCVALGHPNDETLMKIPRVLVPVLKVVRSFYFLVGGAFLVWMLVFDANDLGKQFDIYRKYQDLLNEKQYYLDNIETVKKDRAELMSSPALLEKFAREKYLMKRPGEDLFIMVPEDADGK